MDGTATLPAGRHVSPSGEHGGTIIALTGGELQRAKAPPAVGRRSGARPTRRPATIKRPEVATVAGARRIPWPPRTRPLHRLGGVQAHPLGGIEDLTGDWIVDERLPMIGTGFKPRGPVALVSVARRPCPSVSFADERAGKHSAVLARTPLGRPATIERRAAAIGAAGSPRPPAPRTRNGRGAGRRRSPASNRTAPETKATAGNAARRSVPAHTLSRASTGAVKQGRNRESRPASFH